MISITENAAGDANRNGKEKTCPDAWAVRISREIPRKPDPLVVSHAETLSLGRRRTMMRQGI